MFSKVSFTLIFYHSGFLVVRKLPNFALFFPETGILIQPFENAYARSFAFVRLSGIPERE
jgi:hypothetical protein